MVSEATWLSSSHKPAEVLGAAQHTQPAYRAMVATSEATAVEALPHQQQLFRAKGHQSWPLPQLSVALMSYSFSFYAVKKKIPILL